ncbi:MAG: hypothetical protein V3U84_08075 [Thiotrichaceae bacterium]
MATEIFTEIVSDSDRDLVITGLQSLWRERVAAFHVACNVFGLSQSGSKPNEADFGITEVVNLLRKYGAAPEKF